MGAIGVVAYVAVVWLALGALAIGLFNVAKWRVRSAAGTADAKRSIHATTSGRLPGQEPVALPAPTPAMPRQRVPTTTILATRATDTWSPP
jgi:hypothetical protein